MLSQLQKLNKMSHSSCVSHESNGDQATSKTRPIEMAALGRNLHVGMLYDFLSDSILSCPVKEISHSIQPISEEDQGSVSDDDQSIVSVTSSLMAGYKEPCSEQPLKNQDAKFKDDTIKLNLVFSFDRGPTSKWNHVKLDNHLMSSVMVGMVEASSGASLYLKDETDTCQAARTLCVRLVVEGGRDELLDKETEETEETEETGTATHIISEVQYGAEAFIILHHTLTRDEVKEEIEDKMDDALNVFVTSLRNGSDEGEMLDIFPAKFYVDCKGFHEPPLNCSLTEAREVIRKMMIEMENDPCYAVPITIWLRPLNKAATFYELDEEVMKSCRRTLDGMEKIKAKVVTLLKEEGFTINQQQRCQLRGFHSCIERYTKSLCLEVKKLLPLIRSGVTESLSVRKILDIVHEGVFREDKLEQWLTTKIEEMKAFQLVSKLSEEAIMLVPTLEQLDEIKFRTKWLVVLVLPPTDANSENQLQSMKDYVEKYQCIVPVFQDSMDVQKKPYWFAEENVRQELLKTAKRMYEQARRGIVREEQVTFVMTSALPGSCPYCPTLVLFDQGELVENDFQLPSQPKNIRLKRESSGSKKCYIAEWDCDQLLDVLHFVFEYKGDHETDWSLFRTSGPVLTIRLDNYLLHLNNVRLSLLNGYRIRVAAVSVIGRGEFSSILKVRALSKGDPTLIELETQGWTNMGETNRQQASEGSQVARGNLGYLHLQEETIAPKSCSRIVFSMAEIFIVALLALFCFVLIAFNGHFFA